MRLRRGHAIFVHEIWLKCVFQRSSPAPVRTLAHRCRGNAWHGVNCARALRRSAQPICPLVGVLYESCSSFGTAIQSSPNIFALSNAPSPIPSRSGRMLDMFSGKGILLLRDFTRHGRCPQTFCLFLRGFWHQGTNIRAYEHFKR